MSDPAGPVEAASPRALFPLLVMLTTTTGIVASLGAPLVPEIAASEGVSLAAAQWALTCTLLAGAVTTPILGRLGSGRLRRPVLLAGLGSVVAGGLLAALPLGFGALLAGRTLQGLGFGLYPLVLAIARDHLPADRLRRAMASLSVANVVGAGLGFPVTALVASRFGVPGAFWLAVMLSGATLALSALAVPGAARGPRAPVDWVGALLLGGGTFCVLLALSQAGRWGWASRPTTGVLVAGLLLMLACGRWVLRRPHPVVDLRLAGRPGVLGANVVAVLAGCGMYITIALAMILLQAPASTGYGLGRSVVVAGLAMTPYALGSVVGNRLGLALATRIGADMLLPLGALAFVLANVALALWRADVWQVLVAMAVSGFGSGFSFGSMPWLMARFIPAAETSSAMSLNVVFRYLGFSLGAALSLALLEAFAGADGVSTAAGFTASALAGAAVCLVAAVVSWSLAVRVVRRGGAASSPAPTGWVPAD